MSNARTFLGFVIVLMITAIPAIHAVPGARAAEPTLAIEQTEPGNIFVQPKLPKFFLTSSGDAVTWRVHNLAGTQLASGQLNIAGRTALNLPTWEVGYYRLSLTVKLDGAEIGTSETTFAILTPFDGTHSADAPYGMVGHFEWPRQDDPDYQALELAKLAGVAHVRESVKWQSVEREKGVYNFATYDKFRDAMNANGMNWMPVSLLTNPHYDCGATPYSPEGRQGFSDHSRRIVNRYPQDVDWIEIYNEFNHKNFGDKIGNGCGGDHDGPANMLPEYYLPLLKQSHQKIKASRTGVTVVGGVVANDPEDTSAEVGIPLKWLEALFKLGGLDYMDVLSVHPYRYPNGPAAARLGLEKLDALVREYNDGKSIPIWVSEQGWPTYTGQGGVSERNQAVYLVRTHMILQEMGVERIFWYDFSNDGISRTEKEHTFGLIHNVNEPDNRWTPKPGYVAYSVMTRQLAGADFVGHETVGSGNGSYVFNQGAGQTTRVMWATDGASPPVVIHTDEPITVTTMLGATTTRYPSGGTITLDLKWNPIYVTGNVSSVTIA